MPPLYYHKGGCDIVYPVRRFSYTGDICGVDDILRVIYLEAVVAEVPLLFPEEKLRILHRIRDHGHIISLLQRTAHKTRIMADAALEGIYGTYQNDLAF